MPNLETKYLGLELKSPIIIGSCGLTAKVENIIKMEEQGAGAVVLKSIFEEEILQEYEQILREEPEDSGRDEYLDYLDTRIREERLKKYIHLIREAKSSVKIPIIGSINCTSPYEWISFAREIEKAGADALELNIYIPPSDAQKESQQTEETYLNTAKEVMKQLKIPVAIKLTPYFTELSSMIHKLSDMGVDGIVLFNKFYNPDIDIDTLQIKHANALSNSQEYTLPLRWIAMNADTTEADLIGSCGIRDSATIIKMILAGATGIQMVSPMYNRDDTYIPKLLKEIKEWMDKHHFKSIKDFKGLLSQKRISNPQLYERVQFMRYFS